MFGVDPSRTLTSEKRHEHVEGFVKILERSAIFHRSACSYYIVYCMYLRIVLQ